MKCDSGYFDALKVIAVHIQPVDKPLKDCCYKFERHYCVMAIYDTGAEVQLTELLTDVEVVKQQCAKFWKRIQYAKKREEVKDD